jgi:DNA-binding response OmpR family regulator
MTPRGSAERKPRVLFVDDEKDITTVMKKGFEAQGFAIDTFNDSKEALSHFKKGSYDAIIVDIRMPGMSGIRLAKEIWKMDADARICLLTAFEIYENEAKKVFPEFKTFCFVKKPVTASFLIKHVQSHFSVLA